MGKPIYFDRPAFIICCHWWFMSLWVLHTGSHMSPHAYTHTTVLLMTFEFIIQRHNQHTKLTFNGIDRSRAFPLSTSQLCLTSITADFELERKRKKKKKKNAKWNFLVFHWKVLFPNRDGEITLSNYPSSHVEGEKIILGPTMGH